ncbi:MAG: hypothetical protein ABIQ02_14255 [Saprospiraceae bacterium]
MIAHWCTPDEKATLRPERLSKSSLWHKVRFIHDQDQTCSPEDMMIISFDKVVSQRIKKNLYQFSTTPTQALNIVDCGNFKQKKPESIIPLLQEITASGAVSLLLGAPLGFMRHQVSGMKMASIIKESNLDDDIHLRTDGSGPLFQYIGTQRHLVTESHLRVEGHLRLSDIRDDLSLAEPCIRDSGAMIYHCDSLSAAEAGYLTGMSGSGLSIMEACQLFRYAGASQSLSSVGIYGYHADSDESGLMANALAQMIWYMLEGSTLREDPLKSQLTQYVVQFKDNEHTLLFYKSEISGRWWVENKEGLKVPCSYMDYRKSCEEDYSELIIKTVLG